MGEKKLTDDEIVNALMHCGSQHHIYGCKDCPMNGIEDCYDEPLTDYAYSLILRLQGENERLQAKYRNLEINYEAVYEEYRKYQIENAELQKQVDEQEKDINALLDTHIYKKGVEDGKEQAVKDTAKEICDLILEHWKKGQLIECDWLIVAISERYGVEVE